VPNNGLGRRAAASVSREVLNDRVKMAPVAVTVRRSNSSIGKS
jgi:hypothetical protein